MPFPPPLHFWSSIWLHLVVWTRNSEPLSVRLEGGGATVQISPDSGFPLAAGGQMTRRRSRVRQYLSPAPAGSKEERRRAGALLLHPSLHRFAVPLFLRLRKLCLDLFALLPTAQNRVIIHIMSMKTYLAGLNARGSRRQWWGTTKPGGGGGRECSRGVLHPPLPLSLTDNLRLLPNVGP